MKTDNLAALSGVTELLNMAGEDTVLLQTPEGREFLLVEVDDSEDAEIQAIR